MATSDDKASVLGRLQHDLQSIYRVESPLSVADFVIDEARWQERSGSGAPEELLVVENEGELEVGLFVDDAVVAELTGDREAWTHRRLQAHCRAIEGVSHFLYLTQRASMPRPVSQLELELQAEVDKFATVMLALWEVGRRDSASVLLKRLFDRVSYRENLSPDERERYERANVLARLYCRFLEAKYVVRNSIEGFLADLRRMYRLGAGDKLSYVACGTAP
jgi:hypothetical protein